MEVRREGAENTEVRRERAWNMKKPRHGSRGLWKRFGMKWLLEVDSSFGEPRDGIDSSATIRVNFEV